MPNISRSKDNQTTKFCQLIEYNMRNIVLEKPWAKCYGEASPRPFFKYFEIDRIFESTFCNVIQFLFIAYSSRVLQNYIKTKVPTSCFDLKKTKLVSLPSFLHDF